MGRRRSLFLFAFRVRSEAAADFLRIRRAEGCADEVAEKRGEAPEAGFAVVGFVEDSVDRFSDLHIPNCRYYKWPDCC